MMATRETAKHPWSTQQVVFLAKSFARSPIARAWFLLVANIRAALVLQFAHQTALACERPDNPITTHEVQALADDIAAVLVGRWAMAIGELSHIDG